MGARSGREGELCGEDLRSVAALACPWYGLGQSKASTPQQLARMDDSNPDQESESRSNSSE